MVWQNLLMLQPLLPSVYMRRPWHSPSANGNITARPCHLLVVQQIRGLREIPLVEPQYVLAKSSGVQVRNLVANRTGQESSPAFVRRLTLLNQKRRWSKLVHAGVVVE